MSQREEAGTAGRAGLAEVARGSALNLAGAVCSAVATLAITLIVTRHFSRTVAGAFVTATSLFLIVEAIAGLGAGNGAVYFIARLRPAGTGRPPGAMGQSPEGSGRPPVAAADGRVAAILRTAVRPVLVASVLCAVLMVVFAGPLARLLAGGPLVRGDTAPGPAADAIRALAVAVPFAALADTFLGASRGFRNMLPTVVVDRITRPAVQVAGLVAAVAVGRAALLAPLWALPYLPASLAAWLWLRRTRLRPRPAAKPAPVVRPDQAGASPAAASPVHWAVPAHPSSPPARHWTLSAQPGTPPAGPAQTPTPPPTAGPDGHSAQPATHHGQGSPPARAGQPGWPGTRPLRPGLQEVPPALAVLLALSRPVPPSSRGILPPEDQPGAPARPAIPFVAGWAGPVPPPRGGTGTSCGPATQRPVRFSAPATPSSAMPPGPATRAPQVPGEAGGPAKPPTPQAAVPGGPWPADAPPGHPAVPEPPWEAITQPFWFPGEPGLPWSEVPPPDLAVPGPPWARAAPPPSGKRLSALEQPEQGFWAFTAPRALAGVAQIVLQRLDIVLVAVISGPAQAAVYAAATRFLVAGQLANAALIQAAQPQLSRLFAIGDRAAAGAVYRATTAWLIVLTWPLYLLSAIFGPQLLAVFGRSYQDGATVMVILALAMLMATACGQVDLVLTMAGRSRWSLYNGLLAVVVSVALDLALIPRAGITGAALGWAAALAVSNLIPLVQVAWVARIHPFGRGPAAAIVVTALAFGAVPLAARAALGPGLAASLTGVAVGALLAVAGLWCCRGALRLAVLPGRQKAQVTREKMNPSVAGRGRR